MHVDGDPLTIFDRVDPNPVASRIEQALHRQFATHEIPRSGDATQLVRKSRDHHDQPQSWRSPQSRSKNIRNLGGPQVLIFQIDQRLGLSPDLSVGAFNASLPPFGERVARASNWISSQQLRGVFAGRKGVWQLGRQLIWVTIIPVHFVAEDIQRVSRHRCRVVPSFAENRLSVPDRWPLNRNLSIMPRRAITVGG